MIRVVSFPKVALAGAAGAVAWELALRPLLLAGLPFADLVQMLGHLVAPKGPALAWWLAGMSLHMVVGVIWATFYAYFFWSLLPVRPLWQGLVFALGPAVLALSLVYPQLGLMLTPGPTARVDFWDLAAQVSWGERAGVALGHAAYGAALGLLYTRPVGYRVGRRPSPPRTRGRSRRRPRRDAADGSPSAFIFATGIECSYPTIEGGRWRRDQMAACGHYRAWPTDLELCLDIGVSHLRYGPPLHLINPAPGHYDWSFADPMMQAMAELGLTPIVDLCHFGLPDWLESFQNPGVPRALSDYADAFAARYPWVRFYTPVNEMYVCARFSALDGVWNEQRRDEQSFVAAVRNLAAANILMMQALLRRRPDAVFINSESGELHQAATPDPEVVRIAQFENQRRFLPLDLIYAHEVEPGMRAYLRDNGLANEDYAWFMRQPTPRRAILGVDYYQWNEKLIDTQGRPRALGELFGWYVIAMQYWERYRRPMMHTETNHLDARVAPRWLWRQWHNVQLIRKAGVPVVGFTWYSLTDQVDWDIGLARALGNVDPVGLFDLNRDPRPAGQAYRQLIRTFGDEPWIQDCPTLRELLA